MAVAIAVAVWCWLAAAAGSRLFGGDEGAVEVAQPHAADAGPAQTAGPPELVPVLHLEAQLQLVESVAGPSQRQQHQSETGVGEGPGGGVVVGVEQAAPCRRCLGHAARRHQRTGMLGQDRRAFAVGVLHQVDGTPEELDGDVG
jgi:hypothetical protein